MTRESEIYISFSSQTCCDILPANTQVIGTGFRSISHYLAAHGQTSTSVYISLQSHIPLGARRFIWCCEISTIFHLKIIWCVHACLRGHPFLFLSSSPCAHFRPSWVDAWTFRTNCGIQQMWSKLRMRATVQSAPRFKELHGLNSRVFTGHGNAASRVLVQAFTPGQRAGAWNALARSTMGACEHSAN